MTKADWMVGRWQIDCSTDSTWRRSHGEERGLQPDDDGGAEKAGGQRGEMELVDM